MNVTCPNCDTVIPVSTKDYARRVAIQGAGRKPVLTPCEFCGREFGTVAMRVHRNRCTKNPNRRATRSDIKLTPCRFCTREFSETAMHLHIPRCPNNPWASKKPRVRKKKTA
jgi:hypothetical protein